MGIKDSLQTNVFLRWNSNIGLISSMNSSINESKKVCFNCMESKSLLMTFYDPRLSVEKLQEEISGMSSTECTIMYQIWLLLFTKQTQMNPYTLHLPNILYHPWFTEWIVYFLSYLILKDVRSPPCSIYSPSLRAEVFKFIWNF